MKQAKSIYNFVLIKYISLTLITKRDESRCGRLKSALNYREILKVFREQIIFQ